LNPRPSGYEPDELPGCSTPRQCSEVTRLKIEVKTLELRGERDKKLGEKADSSLRSE
jgi:hypothetical protein